MDNKLRKYLTVLALSISGGSIYLIPYIKYVFYDYQIEAMGITNQQSGLLLSVFAAGTMLLYIPGGMMADRFSAKKCILFSLISTTVLTFIYAFTFTMSFNISLLIWLLFAVTTTFVFWSSLMKTIRMTADDDEQGVIFGLYYAGNGIAGAIGNSAALWASGLATTAKGSLFNAVSVIGLSTAVAALMVVFILKNDNAEDGVSDDEKIKFEDVKVLVKNPVVWLFSLVIFCGYTMYSSTTYFTPYLTNVIGVSPEDSGIFSIIRTYLFMLLAPVGGYLADKVFKSTSKWFMTAFTILGLMFIGVMNIPSTASPFFISVFTLLPGAVGLALYGVLFSIVDEAKIPLAVTGTAVGIASITGYTPDLFMSAMFGTWLDNYGNTGYTYIFIYLAVIAFIGTCAAYAILRHCRKVESMAPGKTALGAA